VTGVCNDSAISAVALATPPVRPLTDFRCYILSLAGAAQASAFTLSEYKGGAFIQKATVGLAVARAQNAHNLVTGNSTALGPGGAGYTGRANHVARLDWSRELTDAEKLAAYLELRAVLATMGKAI
jgi:hypothetical protein